MPLRLQPPCPNLKELFGDRYRIGHDSAADKPSERKDPWLTTIPCRGGVVIYPHGANVLAVEIDFRPNLAKRLAAIPGVRLHQCGDREKTFLFPVDLFDKVAELVRPKRKRRWNEEDRKAQAERFARTKGSFSAPEIPKSSLADLHAVRD
jgi:hypothetical protein